MGMSDVFEQLAAISEQLVQYQIHNDEFLLLQATILSNAGMSSLPGLPQSGPHVACTQQI